MVTDDRNDQGRGARVARVMAGGPCDVAGLREGDLIIGAGGAPVRQNADIRTAVEASPSGSHLTLDVVRGAETIKIRVTLGRRPAPGKRTFSNFGPIAPNAGQPVILGVETNTLGQQTRQSLDLPNTNGALVIKIMPNSPAENVGLQRNDVIVALDGEAVNNPDDLARLSEQRAGKRVELAFYRSGRLIRQQLALADPLPAANPPPAIARPSAEPVVPAERPASDRQRVEDLERRVRELERRLAELEAMLRAALERGACSPVSHPGQTMQRVFAAALQDQGARDIGVPWRRRECEA